MIVRGGRPDDLVPKATPVWDFTSTRTLLHALQTNRIPGNIHFLLLDLEHWSLTPATEQANPVASARQAFQAAEKYGKYLIFTPAVDLVSAIEPNEHLAGSERYSSFDAQVVAPGVKVSNIFEIQSQQTEGTPFATIFAPEAIKVALSSHLHARVFAGLSTNPDGRRVTSTDLLELYLAAIKAGATGFWLNIPEAGVACPACGQAQPSVAVTFLEGLPVRSESSIK